LLVRTCLFLWAICAHILISPAHLLMIMPG
jgi:hypothetical protein